MMKFAFFQGCNIPVRIEQYARAARAVFAVFNTELVEIREFNCCGYPVRNVDEKAYILPSARNIAVAEKENLDIAVICNCCYASLMKAKNTLDNNAKLREELNLILAKEGLQYTGKVKINHFLSILHNDIGVKAISAKLVHKVKEVKVSVLQGCHILRPREITRFDNSFVPEITDALVRLTGAENLDWQGRLECCGAALAGINDSLSRDLLREKIVGARRAGAHYIVPICAYCHLQLDTAQLSLEPESGKPLAVLLYPQLLGLCLGISAAELGLDDNKTMTEEHIRSLTASLGPPEEEKKKRKAKKKQEKQAA